MRGLALLVGICSVYSDSVGGGVAAFSPSYPSTSKSFAINRKLMSTCLSMSTPGGGGDWDNDDFLNSLGGGDSSGMDGSGTENGGDSNSIEYKNPGNDLTDDEITAMAMNSARFYNTDTPMEEVYGSPRQGPPLKQQQDDSADGDDLQGEFQ